MKTRMRVDQLTNTQIQIPGEIIEEILSRLPVKSILRFRSVSKPWLSHISDPSFTKLHFTRAIAAHRTALFITANDHHTFKLPLLSAARDGGHVTHLMALDNTSLYNISDAKHLKGLVCFTCGKPFSRISYTHAFVLNPSTRKIFKLPYPDSMMKNYKYLFYLFGFDESRNEHKVLNISIHQSVSREPNPLEIMIFSLSTYSWRKIVADLPDGFSDASLYTSVRSSVCVNSVVHIMLYGEFDILAFDLRTEKFSTISTPQGVVPHVSSTEYTYDGVIRVKDNKPRMINVNGCIGVVCHDRVLESNEMHIWILQDYENRVWVRETITFPMPWLDLKFPFPSDVVNMDEIIFSWSKRLRNRVLDVLIYNRKTRCFKSLQFTLGH